MENTWTRLGRPLPGGTLRVYEAAAGGPIFAGEDRIPHTPEGETLELTLGRAFDVTGESRRTSYETLSQRSYETAQEIVLRNAKDEAVEVRVTGTMPAGWKMLRESAAPRLRPRTGLPGLFRFRPGARPSCNTASGSADKPINR